jgi:hypothetical protein
MITRRSAILVSFLLTACSSVSNYTPPAAPSENVVTGQARSVAKDVKLIAPWEISGVRQTDRGGPGAYYVCLREANPPPDKRQRYYAIFFDGDDPKGARLSVIMDECEKQTFSPLPAGPTTPLPADTRQPAGHKKRRGSMQ